MSVIHVRREVKQFSNGRSYSPSNRTQSAPQIIPSTSVMEVLPPERPMSGTEELTSRGSRPRRTRQAFLNNEKTVDNEDVYKEHTHELMESLSSKTKEQDARRAELLSYLSGMNAGGVSAISNEAPKELPSDIKTTEVSSVVQKTRDEPPKDDTKSDEISQNTVAQESSPSIKQSDDKKSDSTKIQRGIQKIEILDRKLEELEARELNSSRSQINVSGPESDSEQSGYIHHDSELDLFKTTFFTDIINSNIEETNDEEETALKLMEYDDTTMIDLNQDRTNPFALDFDDLTIADDDKEFVESSRKQTQKSTKPWKSTENLTLDMHLNSSRIVEIDAALNSMTKGNGSRKSQSLNKTIAEAKASIGSTGVVDQKMIEALLCSLKTSEKKKRS